MPANKVTLDFSSKQVNRAVTKKDIAARKARYDRLVKDVGALSGLGVVPKIKFFNASKDRRHGSVEIAYTVQRFERDRVTRYLVGELDRIVGVNDEAQMKVLRNVTPSVTRQWLGEERLIPRRPGGMPVRETTTGAIPDAEQKRGIVASNYFGSVDAYIRAQFRAAMPVGSMLVREDIRPNYDGGDLWVYRVRLPDEVVEVDLADTEVRSKLEDRFYRYAATWSAKIVDEVDSKIGIGSTEDRVRIRLVDLCEEWLDLGFGIPYAPIPADAEQSARRTVLGYFAKNDWPFVQCVRLSPAMRESFVEYLVEQVWRGEVAKLVADLGSRQIIVVDPAVARMYARKFESGAWSPDYENITKRAIVETFTTGDKRWLILDRKMRTDGGFDRDKDAVAYWGLEPLEALAAVQRTVTTIRRSGRRVTVCSANEVDGERYYGSIQYEADEASLFDEPSNSREALAFAIANLYGQFVAATDATAARAGVGRKMVVDAIGGTFGEASIGKSASGETLIPNEATAPVEAEQADDVDPSLRRRLSAMEFDQ